MFVLLIYNSLVQTQGRESIAAKLTPAGANCGQSMVYVDILSGNYLLFFIYILARRYNILL